jgi:hypothetical protein
MPFALLSKMKFSLLISAAVCQFNWTPSGITLPSKEMSSTGRALLVELEGDLFGKVNEPIATRINHGLKGSVSPLLKNQLKQKYIESLK